MRCRLGCFSPRPGSRDFTHYLRDHRTAGKMTQALEEMLGVRMSRSAATPSESGTYPDLLETIGPAHADRAWVEPVAAQMESMQRKGADLRLLACEYEEGPNGFLTLAVSAPRMRFELFERDWMQIGFAASREGDGTVRAWPRLLREVCANGSLVCVADFDRHEGATGIAEAVAMFLTLEAYEPAIASLRETRNERVHDPRSYLDEVQRLDDFPLSQTEFMESLEEARRFLEQMRSAHMESIKDRFQNEGDPSLYGLFNAITATARDIEDWRERLLLEEWAGRIAWLRRPVPEREGTLTLSPD